MRYNLSYLDNTPANTIFTHINHLIMTSGVLFETALQNKPQVKELQRTMCELLHVNYLNTIIYVVNNLND